MRRTLFYLKYFWEALGKFRRQAAIFIAISLVAALLDGLGLSMIVPILDTILHGQEKSAFGSQIAALFGDIDTKTLLIGSAVLFVISMVLKEGFVLWREYFTARFGMNLRNHWRQILSSAIFEAEEGALSEDRRGALLDILINQTHNSGKFVQFVLQMLINFVFVVVMFGIMISVSWFVTLIVILSFGGLTMATYLPARRHSGRLGRKAVTVALNVSATVSESLAGFREIKVLSQESSVVSDIARLSAQQTTLNVRQKIILRLPWAAGNLLVAFLTLGGIIYYAIAPAGATQELLPTAALFVLVGQRLSNHAASVVSNWMNMRTQYPSLLMITKTLNTLASHRVVTGTLPFDNLKSDIQLKNVSFQYESGTPILNNLSLSFDRGVVTTISGPSGSGKSTIADLLFGLRTPRAGSVMVNGRGLQTYDMRSWRQRCAYVSQRPFLFNGTILDNIRLGRPDASFEEIEKAARQAYAHDFIEAFENGYQTSVGEAGGEISGGQAHRITIARALLRNPDFYVFDEPTSALDSKSRDVLHSTFRSLAKMGKVVVIITHDSALVDGADVTYEIRNGALISPPAKPAASPSVSTDTDI